MGDVAMTVPVIRALVSQYPEVRVTVVSRPFFRPFFEDMERVHFFGVDLRERHKGFIGIYRLFLDLKKLDIHYVADFHNVLRSKILRTFFKFSGARTASTDKGRAEKKALTRSKDKIFLQLKPMVHRHVDTLKKLGFNVSLSYPDFPPKRELSGPLSVITGKKEDTKWIGIAPFAQHSTKVYPKDLMMNIIFKLASDPKYRLFLFGGKEEMGQLTELQQNLSNVQVLTGSISFTEELQLIQHLDVMLSMDSGNAHIAAMYGIPVISLWGQTHPYAGFAPFHQPAENSLTSDRSKYPLIPTSIYGNKEVAGYEDAMRTIAPETVIQQIIFNLNS